MDFEPANGEETPLRRIKMRVPRGHHLSALTFVIRSEDGGLGRSRWLVQTAAC
jgi:hypothetical protein